jgi:hypothetical protein
VALQYPPCNFVGKGIIAIKNTSSVSVVNGFIVLSLRAGTQYFYPATVVSGTGRKNKNKKNHVQKSS